MIQEAIHTKTSGLGRSSSRLKAPTVRAASTSINGVAWTVLTKRTNGELDRTKCKTALGTERSDRQAVLPKGWTLYRMPTDLNSRASMKRSATTPYYIWVGRCTTRPRTRQGRADRHRQWQRIPPRSGQSSSSSTSGSPTRSATSPKPTAGSTIRDRLEGPGAGQRQQTGTPRLLPQTNAAKTRCRRSTKVRCAQSTGQLTPDQDQDSADGSRRRCLPATKWVTAKIHAHRTKPGQLHHTTWSPAFSHTVFDQASRQHDLAGIEAPLPSKAKWGRWRARPAHDGDGRASMAPVPRTRPPRR